jgi:predicted DCC family thiol-disulfide oxidoreductase YuxK
VTIDLGHLQRTAPPAATLVFDGDCGMCTRSVRLLRRLDRTGRVEVLAAQVEGVRERTGLTVAETEAAAWTVSERGDRVGGARAIALAIAVARGASWPLLPWRVPGLPWVLDRVYRFVAEHRAWFPGETPWCEQHAGSCAG